jgi:hypothetical protein
VVFGGRFFGAGFFLIGRSFVPDVASDSQKRYESNGMPRIPARRPEVPFLSIFPFRFLENPVFKGINPVNPVRLTNFE